MAATGVNSRYIRDSHKHLQKSEVQSQDQWEVEIPHTYRAPSKFFETYLCK